MEYKPSRFNYYVEFCNNVIAFNAYSGEIVRTLKTAEIIEMLNGSIAGKIHDDLFKELYSRGFIVNAAVDETANGQLKYYNNIFDSSLNLVLLSTEQCNFRCSYCYESFKRGEMSEAVQDGIVRFLQKNIYKYTGLNLEWFGGEPLLAMNVIDRLSPKIQSIMKNVHKRMTSSVTTNGYFLNYDVFRRLQKYNVNSYQVTLDGLQGTHDATRKLANGDGTFDVIIDNLRKIRDFSKSSTFDICIRTNFTQKSIDTIPEYIQYLYEEFGKDRRFSFYFRPVGDWGGERIGNLHDSLLTSLADFYNPIINSPYTLNYNFYSELLRNTICSAAKKNSYVIGSDATIYKCTMLFDEDYNKIGKLHPDGKIDMDSDLLTQWLNPIRNKEECKNCIYECSCRGGTCPASGFVLGNMNCDGYEKNSMEHILKLLLKDSIKTPEASVVSVI